MYSRLLLLVPLLLLGACSPKQEVTFDPSVGDEHDYWTYSQMSVAGYSQTQTSKTLQHYKVTNTSPLTLEITSDYLDIDGGGSRNRINSLDNNKHDKKVRRLFESGFEISIDPKSGQLLDFRGRDDEVWQAMLKDGGQRMVDSLKQNMLSPGILQAIPAKVGAKINLPEFAGQQVSVTVKEVTDTEITTVIESNHPNQDPNMYGEMVLNRNDGWLKQLVLVAKQQLHSFGRDHQVRLRIAMLPKDQPILFNFTDYVPYNDWTPLFNPPKNEDVMTPAQGSKLLSYAIGSYDSDTNGLKLIVPQKAAPLENVGTVKLRDIQSFDDKGKALDLQFSWISYMGDYEANLVSNQQVLPLGWNKVDELKQIDRFKATAEYYPTEYISKTITWQPGKQTFDIDGVSVAITPVADQENHYYVRTIDTPNKQFRLFAKGLNGEVIMVDHKRAEFMDSRDQMMFSQLSTLPHEENYIFKLKETPKQVTFYVSKFAEKPTYEREISFISQEDYVDNPKLPPLSESSLFGYYGDEAKTQQQRSFADLQVESESNQSAQINLPDDWASICTITTDSDYQENGHKLAWVAQQDDSRDQFYTSYRLATDDNHRQYFYGISVTSKLHCDGTPKWEKLAFSADDDTPWLVPVSAIKGLDLQQTVAEFLQRYHLNNASEEPLNIISADGHYITDPQETKLADIVTEQQQLRVAGKVHEIDHLSFTGEPLERQWTNTFAALP